MTGRLLKHPQKWGFRHESEAEPTPIMTESYTLVVHHTRLENHENTDKNRRYC